MMVPTFKQQFEASQKKSARFSIRFVAFVLAFSSSLSPALLLPNCLQEDDEKLPGIIQQRLRLKTPAKDKLLHRLEKDYVKLLKQSRDPKALLEAEYLLETTNDNTHWTNYSKATQILRRTRDKAAIPLLLWYIVEHSKRSSCHVMIPEYARTISLISGHQVDSPYVAGPNLENRMRSKVDVFVKQWWSKEMGRLETAIEELTDAQLRVIVSNLLKDVRRNGDFNGSGGKPNSAYFAYHNVYYRIINSSSSDRYELPELHPVMITLVLEPSGYGQAVKGTAKRFPYEVIPILSKLAENGHRKKIEAIADDREQNSSVRMVCVYSLFRAGEVLRTEHLIEMLKEETNLENRLINLLSLRWGGEKAVPVLLSYMEDPNIEIATAAACALMDAQPDEALPKFRKLLDRNHYHAPILLLSSLSSYKTATSRAILADLLEKSLDGTSNKQHLGRILSAFMDACDLPRPRSKQGEDRTEEHARLALSQYQQRVSEMEVLMRNLSATVDSARTQLKIAREIEVLRRKEYKRLLILQGDNIVTAEQTRVSADRLETIVAEVKTIRSQLEQAEARLAALKNAE